MAHKEEFCTKTSSLCAYFGLFCGIKAARYAMCTACMSWLRIGTGRVTSPCESSLR